jgi:glycosyltransferase involved in cell wall biosynthesis
MKAVLLPDYTGTNPYQRELACALERRGVDVRLVESHGPFTPLWTIREHGLPSVVHLHWLHPLFVGNGPATTIIKSIVTLVQLLALRVAGVRLVWTVHNVVEHDRTAPRVEVVARHLLGRLCHTIVCHCPSAIDAVSEVYRWPDSVGERTDVVEHGHYIDSYVNDVDRATARDRLGLDDGATVLYLGRVSEYKNVLGLVEDFCRLEDPHLNLVVAGSPVDETLATRIRAAAAADDRIRTRLEFVPAEELQVYLNAADLVATPFRQVLNSGSVLLAMSFGRAVLAPTDGCIPWVLADAGGFTYESDGPAALRDALRRALSKDLAAAGHVNYRKAETFGWDRIARKTHRIYRDAPTETRVTG